MAPFKASRAEWDTRGDESTRGYKTPFNAGKIIKTVHGPRDNIVIWVIGIWEKSGPLCHVPIFSLNVEDGAKLDGDHGIVTIEKFYPNPDTDGHCERWVCQAKHSRLSRPFKINYTNVYYLPWGTSVNKVT